MQKYIETAVFCLPAFLGAAIVIYGLVKDSLNYKNFKKQK